MNRSHVGYNAKGRQSTSGSRKKGKRRAQAGNPTQPEFDPNASIVVPKSEEQKELDRRERLRQEVSICLS